MDVRNHTFSVIVAAYNCEEYIVETMESIAAQSFTDYEVIIVEDCSLDSTHGLIEAYIQNRDHWNLYVNEKNRGVGYSRNRAFSLAQGRFVAILDGDDVWYKEKLAKQHEVLKNGGIDICYSSYAYMDAASRDMGFTYRTKAQVGYQALLKENYIGCSTAVISQEIAKTYKMKENMLNEDFYFWLQVLKQGYVGAGILEPLVKYRIHEKGRSYNKFKAAYNRYFIYRENEGLSFLDRCFYFMNYAFRASKKFILVYWHSRRLRRRDGMRDA